MVDDSSARTLHGRDGHWSRGHGKNVCVHYPVHRPPLRWKASDPERKIGGLILEVKGGFSGRSRHADACRARLRLHRDSARWRHLLQPAPQRSRSLRGRVRPSQRSSTTCLASRRSRSGSRHTPPLLKFVILLRRLADGYATFAEVWARATGWSSLRSFNACARISSMRMIALPIDFIGCMVVLMDHPVTTHALSGPCVPPLFDGVLRTCSNQPLPSGLRPTAVLETTRWERRFRTSGRLLSRACAPAGDAESPAIGSVLACGRSPRNSDRLVRQWSRDSRAATGYCRRSRLERRTRSRKRSSRIPVHLGLRARAHACESAHTLAGYGRFALDRAASRLLTTVH